MSMIGKTLGSFECTALLGKGGMGEVYRAKDQKLGRDVAIKVLPEEFAKDADRIARFQREAKLLASLNHPNIAAIYGLEEADGAHFLVMELIEGDTLADRLKRGAIPVEESLKLALQIAEAFEAAHEKGVIHRDLKPANIKVTPDGKVKVLDFGLAKAFAGDSKDINLSNSPTLSVAATQKGVILGTAAYMSPEQASGETTDKRTDIWAFGVVLFEMLTGRSLFEGNNVSQTLASVIKSEPEWKSLPPSLHPRIRLLLEKCLKKEPKNRYHDIADARVDVQEVLADPSGVFAQLVTTAKPRKVPSLKLPWVAAIAVLCLIAAGAAIWYLKPTEQRRVMRFDYHLPEDQQLNASITHDNYLAISPNGSYFLYTTTEGICIRYMDQMEARLIPGTDENSQRPFSSPDGQWVAYFSGADNKLKKVNISGGAPNSLCDAPGIHDATWHADNTIVYGASRQGVMRVSSEGGIPETLVELKEGTSGNYNRPQLLPDGKSLLFSHWQPNETMILVHSLETGESRDLTPGLHAKYLPTGHIVYRLDDVIYAAPFDLDTLRIAGESVPMAEGVELHDISDEGTLVYIPVSMTAADSNLPQFTLVWVDRQGKEEPIFAEPGLYMQSQISPDGTEAAVSIVTEDGSSDIWILDLVRKNPTRLTRNGNSDNPLWTPDGERIVFVSGDEDKTGIYCRAANGTGMDELLGTVPDGMLIPYSWSKDGKTLITTKLPRRPTPQSGWERLMPFVSGGIWTGAGRGGRGGRGGGESRGDRGGRAGPMFRLLGFNSDIGLLSMEGDHEWEPLLQEEYIESDPQISPDGHWIAYTSSESGQLEVYLRSFPDVDREKWTVSIDGGNSPQWSPDGRELFYIGPDAFMVVTVETDPAVKLGTPKSLFSGLYFGYDLNPDGKRFLAIRPPQPTDERSSDEESASPAPRKINIVVNWFEELKERVPIE